MSDGVFRSKKGFTVVQNSVTKDNNISLRAKGLYVLMQTYITMPDRKYKKSEFMKMVPEGKCTFEGLHLFFFFLLQIYKMYLNAANILGIILCFNVKEC